MTTKNTQGRARSPLRAATRRTQPTARKRLRALPCVAWISLLLFSPLHAQNWTWTGWGGGGFFWAVDFDPADANTLYLAGDVAGMYKTTDRALSWRMINTGLQNYDVYAVAVAPSDSKILYAMTVDGMARSNDAGETWKPLADSRAKKISARRGSTVRGIAIDPATPAIVYAGSGSGGLYKSVDAGETWDALAFTETIEPAVASVVLHNGAVFVCHRRQGLFKSNDNGATWTKPETPPNAAHIAFRRNRAYGAFGRDGVWASDDAGETWRKLPNVPANLDIREVAIGLDDPDTVHFIALENWNGFHGVTRDGGATWKITRNLERDALSNPTLPGSFSRDPIMSRVSSLAIAPGALFIAGNWNNLLSLDDGATWQQRDHGTDITCFTDVRFLGGAVYATAMDQGLYRSDNNGAVWKHLYPLRYREGDNGHQWRVFAWPIEDENADPNARGKHALLATSSPWRGAREYPNTILLSDDDGKTFTARTEGLPATTPKTNTMWNEGYARAFAVDPKNPGTFYLGIDGDADPDGGEPGGVFKSVDAGRSWSRLENQPGSLRMFYGLVVDPLDSNRIYWGACGENSGVWRTLDAGGTWEKTPLVDWVFNLETAPSGTLYAGSSSGLWQSRDLATTWRKIFDSAGRTVVGIAVDPEDENRVWISLRAWGTTAAGGVWRTVDGGETWQDITGDLQYVKPIVIRYNPATRELWAAGTGIFKIQQ